MGQFKFDLSLKKKADTNTDKLLGKLFMVIKVALEFKYTVFYDIHLILSLDRTYIKSNNKCI